MDDYIEKRDTNKVEIKVQSEDAFILNIKQFNEKGEEITSVQYRSLDDLKNNIEHFTEQLKQSKALLCDVKKAIKDWKIIEAQTSEE